MSAQLGARAIPSRSNRIQSNVAWKRNALRCVQHKLRRSSLPPWFSLKVPCHPNYASAEIFRRSNHRCAYCAAPLTEGLNATIDHLLPRCLFQREAIANQKDNRLACCRECNELKSDWVLPLTHHSWRSRETYFATTQRVVLGLKKKAHKTGRCTHGSSRWGSGSPSAETEASRYDPGT